MDIYLTSAQHKNCWTNNQQLLARNKIGQIFGKCLQEVILDFYLRSGCRNDIGYLLYKCSPEIILDGSTMAAGNHLSVTSFLPLACNEITIFQFGLSYLAVADFSSFLTNFFGKKAIFEVKVELRHPKSGPGWVGILKNDSPKTKFWVRPLCYEIPLIFIRGISQS